MDLARLNKIIDVMKKTGDRVIIFDKDDFGMVVMPLSKYEDSLPETGARPSNENQIAIDDINKELSLSREEQADNPSVKNPFLSNSQLNAKENASQAEKNQTSGTTIDTKGNYGMMSDTGKPQESDTPKYYEEPVD